MDEPEWIRDDTVSAIHSMQIAEHGGKEGVLSEGALSASLANPKHYFFYTDPKPDIPGIAARYAHSIAAIIRSVTVTNGRQLLSANSFWR